MDLPYEWLSGYEHYQGHGWTCLVWSPHRHRLASVLCAMRQEISESYSQKYEECTGVLWDPPPSADPPKEG